LRWAFQWDPISSMRTKSRWAERWKDEEIS